MHDGRLHGVIVLPKKLSSRAPQNAVIASAASDHLRAAGSFRSSRSFRYPLRGSGNAEIRYRHANANTALIIILVIYNIKNLGFVGESHFRLRDFLCSIARYEWAVVG